MSNFEAALKELPDDTDLDVHHKTVEDLCWLCLHELDLHVEEEYKHTKKNVAAYKKFIKKFGDEFFQKELNKLFPNRI